MPPCPLRSISGIPCPFCGTTRGVIALIHGDVAHSLVLNPGALLAVTGVLVLVVRWVVLRARLRAAAAPAGTLSMPAVPVWSVGAIVAALWAWQLVKYSTGRPL